MHPTPVGPKASLDWSQRIIAVVLPALVAPDRVWAPEDLNMIDLTTTPAKGTDEAVPGRRCGFPETAARPAALHNSRCVQVALDPSTGKYRLAIG